MQIEQLTTADAKDLVDINSLLKQLVHDPATYSAVTLPVLQEIVGNPKTVVIVARDDHRIIGMGIVFIVVKMRGHYGIFEDMAVDEKYRGQGIGESIARKLLDVAKSRGVKTIELSARPSRIAANKLYQKLGFEHKETNVYRLKL